MFLILLIKSKTNGLLRADTTCFAFTLGLKTDHKGKYLLN